MVRYSREDALTDREFVLLLEGADSLKEPFDIQARFIIYAAGRLGMRSGEIAHISNEWVDRGTNLIKIPSYDNCTKGKYDDEVCGYCRNRLRDYLQTHNTSVEEEVAKLDMEYGDTIDDATKQTMAEKEAREQNKTLDDIKDKWWQPKTEAAVRSIPYDFNTRLQLCVERFFKKYDSFPISKASLNRRVQKAAEESTLQKRIYPHALRATAATTHASRDVSPYALMSVMGWRDMDTARKYVAASDESAARDIRHKHN